MERCPTCGAPVATIFDHVDRDCENDEARSRLLDGFSIDKTGALVIPDHYAATTVRGHLRAICRFRRVVTDTGIVVKDADGDFILKSTRAS